VIADLLPSCVRTVEAFEDIDGEPPFPGEESLICSAVEGRRREFITARRCARRALAGLGHPAAPIRSGPHREPLWPAGVRGSITHCAGYRAAAVTRHDDLAAVGIDAEPHAPLPDGVRESVTVAEERAASAGLPPGVHWDRLLFSAKESVYKAWFPLTGRWLGFEDACLSIDPAAATFRARILIDGTRLDGEAPLTGLTGRFTVGRGLIITAVAVPRSAPAAG
jgi:enterobactin synthetase component D / holo-[acyl-carrier protein] synthase